MRKISNVDDAIEKFKMAAIDNRVCAYNGNYRKANNALDLLKQLYEDPNLWVRLAAAIVMAPWDEINAFNIVKGIKEMDVDMYSFAAKYTLLNWKELSSSNKKCDL